MKVMQDIAYQFALFSDNQKQEICTGIAEDSKEVDDTCGFITVSAYQVYNEFYRGISEHLGEWMHEKIQADIETMQSNYSKTASESTQKMVSSKTAATEEEKPPQTTSTTTAE